MRICLTVEFAGNKQGGGAGAVVTTIAEALAQKGHEVQVASSSLPGLPDRETLSGVKHVRFPVSGNEASGIFGNRLSFDAFLEAGGFDLIFNYAAQSWPTDLTMQALEEGRLKKPAVIAPCGYSGLKNPLFRPYFIRLPGRLSQYRKCIYHSNAYQDYYFAQEHGLQNSVVIPNGAVGTEFDTLPKRGAFRHRLGIGDRPLLLTVANHIRPKGHAFVTHALDRCNVPGAALAIIGNPPKPGIEGALYGCAGACRLRAALRPGKLFLLSGQSRKQIVEALVDADLFVYGSEIECSPLVLIEAMAAGLPFVCRPAGNVRQWERFGRIVDTPDQMARTARTLLDDPTQLDAMGSAAREHWQKAHRWESISEQYEKVFEQCLSEKPVENIRDTTPALSVLLPAYNAEEFIRESVQSILEQTFKDLELIIIDDGSTDDTSKILTAFSDKRLKVYRQMNTGVAGALNTALKEARGRYIARMDADDIAMPDRFEKQIAFLETHPDVDMVGSSFLQFSGDSDKESIQRVVCDPLVIRRYLLAGNCIAHPTVTARASVFKTTGLYDEKAHHVEDYRLWAKGWEQLRFAALAEPVIRYRIHEGNIGRQFEKKQAANALSTQEMLWEKARWTTFRPWSDARGGLEAGQQVCELCKSSGWKGAYEYHLLALSAVCGSAIRRLQFKIAIETAAEVFGFCLANPTGALRFCKNLLMAFGRQGALQDYRNRLNA